MGSEYSIVASIFCSMTFLYDLDSFIHGYTPSQHSIIADFVKIWLIPKVHSAFAVPMLGFGPV